MDGAIHLAALTVGNTGAALGVMQGFLPHLSFPAEFAAFTATQLRRLSCDHCAGRRLVCDSAWRKEGPPGGVQGLRECAVGDVCCGVWRRESRDQVLSA